MSVYGRATMWSCRIFCDSFCCYYCWMLLLFVRLVLLAWFMKREKAAKKNRDGAAAAAASIFAIAFWSIQQDYHKNTVTFA